MNQPPPARTPANEDNDAIPETGKQKRRRYIPDRLFWWTAIASPVIAFGLRFAFDDTAVSWMFCYGASLVLFLMFMVWLLFFSAYSMSVRFGVAAVIVGILAYIGSQYRYVQITGGGVPIFKRRALRELPSLEVETAKHDRRADLTSGVNDFPRFLGPSGDGVLRGRRLARDWDSTPPELVWKRDIGEGWSGFAAVNGFAVTMEQRGEEELVTCYDAATGEPIWQHAETSLHTDPFSSSGPRSTPTIHQGRVYAVGATGIVRCLDGATGNEIWVRDFMAELGVTVRDATAEVAWGRAGSPLIIGNRLVLPVGGADDNVITLRAMDLDSGETIWETGNYQISYATPVYAELGGQAQILSVNQDIVTAHDAESGAILWEHPWPGLSNMNANVSNAVPLDGEHVFLSKGYTHGAELLNVQRDGDNWEVESLWQKKVMKTKLSNVSIRDGYAYGLDDGVLSCVETATGKRMWKKGRYGYGQILLVEDLILVLSEEGELALVEANPQSYVELAVAEALRGQTWNTICLSGDLLLIRNAEEAACFRLQFEDATSAESEDKT